MQKDVISVAVSVRSLSPFLPSRSCKKTVISYSNIFYDSESILKLSQYPFSPCTRGGRGGHFVRGIAIFGQLRAEHRGRPLRRFVGESTDLVSLVRPSIDDVHRSVRPRRGSSLLLRRLQFPTGALLRQLFHGLLRL